MSDESQLQVRPKDGDSSLTVSKARSGLIARGRRDSAMLTVLAGAESEEGRTGFDVVSSDFILNRRPTEEVRKDAEKGDAKQQSILAFGYRFGSGRLGRGGQLVPQGRRPELRSRTV